MADALETLLGDNRPPPDLLTGDMLREKLRDENMALLKRRDELLAGVDRIPEITNDEIAGRVGDFIKQLAALAKAADGKRIDAKEPFLEGGRTVDGFFKHISDPVGAAKKTVEAKLTGYLREKEAAARRKAEEEARRQREEAERLRHEAAAREAAAHDAKGLDQAIEADAKADTAASDALQAEKAADAKAADFSRTRGEYGAVASLRTAWTFDAIDRERLDLEALRHHLPADALEKAVRSFIRAGGRSLTGTTIYETTTAAVR